MFWLFRKKVRSIRRYISRRSIRYNSTKIFHIPTNIAILGASGTGKTLITRKFTSKDYPDEFKQVSEAYSTTITVTSKDRITCKHKIILHDTPGNLRIIYPSLYEQIIRNCDYYIIVVALNDLTSITSGKITIKSIQKRKHESVPIFVFANKSDLSNNNEEVIKERFEFYKFVSSMNYQVIELSAIYEVNVEDYWLQILEDIETRYSIHRRCSAKIFL